jgi:hypothetical protein
MGALTKKPTKNDCVTSSDHDEDDDGANDDDEDSEKENVGNGRNDDEESEDDDEVTEDGSKRFVIGMKNAEKETANSITKPLAVTQLQSQPPTAVIANSKDSPATAADVPNREDDLLKLQQEKAQMGIEISRRFQKEQEEEQLLAAQQQQQQQRQPVAATAVGVVQEPAGVVLQPGTLTNAQQQIFPANQPTQPPAAAVPPPVVGGNPAAAAIAIMQPKDAVFKVPETPASLAALLPPTPAVANITPIGVPMHPPPSFFQNQLQFMQLHQQQQQQLNYQPQQQPFFGYTGASQFPHHQPYYNGLAPQQVQNSGCGNGSSEAGEFAELISMAIGNGQRLPQIQINDETRSLPSTTSTSSPSCRAENIVGVPVSNNDRHTSSTGSTPDSPQEQEEAGGGKEGDETDGGSSQDIVVEDDEIEIDETTNFDDLLSDRESVPVIQPFNSDSLFGPVYNDEQIDIFDKGKRTY